MKITQQLMRANRNGEINKLIARDRVCPCGYATSHGIYMLVDEPGGKVSKQLTVHLDKRDIAKMRELIAEYDAHTSSTDEA